MKNGLKALAAIAVAMFVSGCATHPQTNYPKIESVLIQPFQCSDPVITTAVQNVFVEVLSRHSTAKIVRDGTADIVVEGTVTYGGGSTSQGAIAGSAGSTFGSVFGASNSAAGDYVSGVTALATRNGDVVASTSWGQTLKGGKIFAPEYVAHVVAERLLEQMELVGLEIR
jgi:hypothetical protein